MDAAEQQSILQGGFAATIIVAAIFAGITYLTEGAIDWSFVWLIVFLTSLPWLIYLYLMQ